MRHVRTPTAERARNKWPALLEAFGIDPRALTGRHTACPICGGRDRFRFDNKEGRGTWLCSHCGAGDGFDLITKSLGLPFPEAARRADSIMGTTELPETAPKPATDPQKAREAMEAVWRATVAPTLDDPIDRYLAGRGIATSRPDPRHVRLCWAARYIEEGQEPTTWPAMVAKVTAPDGSGVNLHRTFLTAGGSKAPVGTARKVMLGGLPEGSAVRLMGIVDGTLGIAEGIETALAAAEVFGVSVWAALNANRLEVWEPPAGIRRVVIFGDNDENFVGQAAAYALAARLRRGRYATIEHVEVQIPDCAGWDWNDYLVKGA
jgi:putative DNA primase/helicase